VVLVSSLGVYGTADLPRSAVINESTPLETHPEWRDSYSHAKLRQELLVREYQQKNGFELIVLRPGVIYGIGGGGLSTRIGLNLFGIFLHLGHSNLLPLSYVQNCAEALVIAAGKDEAAGQTYNVYDDDLPTCRQYLREYKRHVEGLRSVPLPYSCVALLSKVVERYHSYSKGQLPAAFTTYTTAILWKGRRFDNSKLKALGWKQLVPTAEGMRLTFEYLRSKRQIQP
jgi:2-alkyl-3-oxoalkanoate reductase